MPGIPHTRSIAINGSGGAGTDIYFTVPAAQVVITEDGLTTQGFTGTRCDENPTPFTTTFNWRAGEVLTLGRQSIASGRAPVLGWPAKNVQNYPAYNAGTTYQLGTGVTYNGVPYVCITANTLGVTPGSDGSTIPGKQGTNWMIPWNYIAGDKMLGGVKSATATATTLRVTEYE